MEVESSEGREYSYVASVVVWWEWTKSEFAQSGVRMLGDLQTKWLDENGSTNLHSSVLICSHNDYSVMNRLRLHILSAKFIPASLRSTPFLRAGSFSAAPERIFILLGYKMSTYLIPRLRSPRYC